MDKGNTKIFTKFKRLSKYFNNEDMPTDYNPNNPQVIYKTKNREDFETKKLEKQTTNYLKNQWQKVSTHIKQKALIYETQRYPSYLDYDLMEQYPIIGAALEIMAEESTTPNKDGKILNIYSESKRVQKELEDLFYNKLNIHTNLVMWIKNMCKYGDNFVYLQIDDELGVTGAKQLTNIEVERIEGTDANRMRTYLDADENEVIFRWKSTDLAEFKFYQIAHFRLLMDDRKLPYGVSILEKARRIWKNLLLVEDAMRTIRLLRAIDRRAYYINVGNIDPADVEGYVNDIASRFKRKRHVDPSTGQEDLKFNVMGFDQDYFIPIRDKDDGTRIETVQGATNVDQIADIEYDLAQLFAALSIPKPFLQYEDSAGEGKNLSMQDIRLARKINRIQQAAINELNKIAIVHLFFLGLEDELHNFELSLNNPSIQADIMRIEYMEQKINVFKNAVSDANGYGIAAMSCTMAMKDIMGMTNDQIKLNLEQQFLERAASAEMEKAPDMISNTTLFDNIIQLYGDEAMGMETSAEDEEAGFEGEGGAGGGGGLGGGLGDLGGEEGLGELEGEEDLGDLGGEEGLGGEEDLGALEGETEEAPAEDTGTEDVGESFSKHEKEKLITENNSKRIAQLMKSIDKMK